MKKFLSFVMVIALLPACSFLWFGAERKVVGSGNPVMQDRSVGQFNVIEVSGQGMLIVTQADTNSLSIEADDNLINYLTSTVESNKLSIKLKENVTVEPRTLIKYYVTLKDIKAVNLQGAIQLMSEKITTPSLVINATGDSQVAISLEVKKLNVKATGASRCSISGVAQEQKLELTGAVVYNAGDLISDTVQVEASGASHVTVVAEKELKAYISGSAVVGYKGEPMLTIKQSGSASISKVG